MEGKKEVDTPKPEELFCFVAHFKKIGLLLDEPGSWISNKWLR